MSHHANRAWQSVCSWSWHVIFESATLCCLARINKYFSTISRILFCMHHDILTFGSSLFGRRICTFRKRPRRCLLFNNIDPILLWCQIYLFLPFTGHDKTTRDTIIGCEVSVWARALYDCFWDQVRSLYGISTDVIRWLVRQYWWGQWLIRRTWTNRLSSILRVCKTHSNRWFARCWHLRVCIVAHIIVARSRDGVNLLLRCCRCLFLQTWVPYVLIAFILLLFILLWDSSTLWNVSALDSRFLSRRSLQYFRYLNMWAHSRKFGLIVQRAWLKFCILLCNAWSDWVSKSTTDYPLAVGLWWYSLVEARRRTYHIVMSLGSRSCEIFCLEFPPRRV